MHIVTLGSGTGQATLLRGLRAYECQVTAIVAVTDNGGHSGQLRYALHIPQVGDTRQCLGALLDEASVWGKLLRHRFTAGELRGLSVGNLMLAALADIDGSLCSAVEEIRRVAGIAQRVLPVSDGDTHIAAELAGGQVIVGEWQIIQRQSPGAIVRLFLHPQVAAHPPVLEAIAAADLLVCCPGSLLTGMLAVLLPTGMQDAIAASRARCVYVCNLMTQPGQTDGYTARQHLALVQQYLGRQADAVVLNNGPLPPTLLDVYAQHGSFPVRNDLTSSGVPLYLADLVEHPDAETLRTYVRPQAAGMQVGLHLIRHDAHKLAAQIMALVSAHD
ncbi:MAG TPA: gluconeogenesis factor YvcK family protein [Candidatus Tectomicrobia bacterium]|jgi:uncharacterized cofD-like protein